MFKYYNPNPAHQHTGDCVIRAISKLTDQSWSKTYFMVCLQGFMMYQMPSTNSVWGRYLYNNGYRRYMLPDTCPDCYTVRDFCADHPFGRYLLALDGHVVAVVDGDYYDTGDSGSELPLFIGERSNKSWRFLTQIIVHTQTMLQTPLRSSAEPRKLLYTILLQSVAV